MVLQLRVQYMFTADMHGVTMTCTEKTTFQVTQLEKMTRDTPAHTHTQTHTDTHTHTLLVLVVLGTPCRRKRQYPGE